MVLTSVECCDVYISVRKPLRVAPGCEPRIYMEGDGDSRGPFADSSEQVCRAGTQCEPLNSKSSILPTFASVEQLLVMTLKHKLRQLCIRVNLRL